MLTELFDRGELKARVESIVPLAEVRRVHEMLAGAPHLRGKVLLSVGRAVI